MAEVKQPERLGAEERAKELANDYWASGGSEGYVGLRELARRAIEEAEAALREEMLKASAQEIRRVVKIEVEKAQREALEEACKANCINCKNGLRAEPSGGVWTHKDDEYGNVFCPASATRRLMG